MQVTITIPSDTVTARSSVTCVESLLIVLLCLSIDKVTISKSDNLCRKLEGLCRQIHRENKDIKVVYQTMTLELTDEKRFIH
jgi:hypothetical protein